MTKRFFSDLAVRLKTSASQVFGSRVEGLDFQDRFYIDVAGKHEWGGGSLRDVNLYRAGAGSLQTDHEIVATNGFVNPTSAGTPSASLTDGTVAVDTTNDLLYFRSGGAWVQAGGSASPTQAINGTASTDTTSTLANATTAIPGLSWSATSGVMYHFKAVGVYRSSATTSGLRLGFRSTVATTYCSWNVQIQQAAAGTDQMYTNVATSLTTNMTSASVVATGTDYSWEMEGIVKPSASGTIAIGFGAETGGQTATIRPGCVLIVTTCT